MACLIVTKKLKTTKDMKKKYIILLVQNLASLDQ